MSAVGVTGHQGIPTPGLSYVIKHLRTSLESQPFVRAYSSLAEGADQLFADIATKLSIPLFAIIPCKMYDTTFTQNCARTEYERLLAIAVDTFVCNYDSASEEAFWQAGRKVVEKSDVLLAIWDGEASRGLGGTADVVEYAESLSKPVQRIWPPGLHR